MEIYSLESCSSRDFLDKAFCHLVLGALERQGGKMREFVLVDMILLNQIIIAK